MISSAYCSIRYITKVSNRLKRKIDKFVTQKDFSCPQGRTLYFLLTQTEDVFQKDIQAEYNLRASTTTEILKQMEKNGLIIRESVSYDSRLKKIILTDKALKYKQQVFDDLSSLEYLITKKISESDLIIFFKVMNQMIDNLSE